MEHDVIDETIKSRPSFMGEKISYLEEKELKANKQLMKLLLAADEILSNFGKKNLERNFYCLNILKVVHVYKPFTSFGELALITNKKRKAKLEVTDD